MNLGHSIADPASPPSETEVLTGLLPKLAHSIEDSASSRADPAFLPPLSPVSLSLPVLTAGVRDGISVKVQVAEPPPTERRL